MVGDPISNLIISLKNAGSAGIKTTTVSYSRMKKAILDVIQKAGFISKVSEEGSGTAHKLVIELAYEDGASRIQNVKRISKFSRRMYVKATDIRPIKNGTGLLVVSTPQGVMAGDDAQKANVGGEALFEIW